MTYAQLGLPFPEATSSPGWAWAGEGDEVEANYLAGFVANALTRLQQDEDPLLADQPPRDALVAM
jgi:hypothetical protein